MTEETNATSETPTNATGSSNGNGSGSSKTWIIIGIIAVVIIGIVAFLYFSNQNQQPEGVVPTPVPPQVILPTVDPNSPHVTANVDINVRSGPGTNYPTYGVAPTGAQALVIGVSEDGTWWNISVSPEKIPAGNAWVSAEYVTATNAENIPVVPAPPLPPDVGIPPVDENSPTVTNFEPINVRSGPGTQYPSYGVAPINSIAPVIGISADGGWYAISISTDYTPDGVAWVSASYVTLSNPGGVEIPIITNPDELPPVAPSPPPEGSPMVTSTDAINVRSGPSNQCTSYGVAPIGASALATGISADGKWYQIQISTEYAPDGIGWVNANYVTATNTENLPIVDSPNCP
jgi:uncharacterized protein YraI